MANVVSNTNSRFPSRNITVNVTVSRARGGPVGGVTVELVDSGGTLDVRSGVTDSDGVIVFRESVGPPPCNPLAIRLPNHNVEKDIGCHNGGQQISRTVSIPGSDPSSSTSQTDGGSSSEIQDPVASTTTSTGTTSSTGDGGGGTGSTLTASTLAQLQSMGASDSGGGGIGGLVSEDIAGIPVWVLAGVVVLGAAIVGGRGS